MAKDLYNRGGHDFEIFYNKFNLDRLVKKLAAAALRNGDFRRWNISEDKHHPDYNKQTKNHNLRSLEADLTAEAFFTWNKHRHDKYGNLRNDWKDDESIRNLIVVRLEYFSNDLLLQQKHPYIALKKSNRRWMIETDGANPCPPPIDDKLDTEERIDRQQRYQLVYRNLPERKWAAFMLVMEFDFRPSELREIIGLPKRTFSNWQQKLIDLFASQDELRGRLSDHQLGKLNNLRKQLEELIYALQR